MNNRISGLDEAIDHLAVPTDEEWGSYADATRAMEGLTVGSFRTHNSLVVDGVVLALPFVFSYRSGRALLKVGPDPLVAPLYEASMRLDVTRDSLLTPTEFARAMSALLPQLERAKFLYEFEGYVVQLQRDGERLQASATSDVAVFRSRGHTAAEAYENLRAYSPELDRMGIDAATQAEIFSLQAVKPEPLTEDYRTFPPLTPDFERVARAYND